MNNQQALEMGVTGIYKQGSQCINGGGACLYKLGDKACIVGWVLTDDLRSLASKHTNKNVYGIIRDVPEIEDYFEGVDLSFLNGLQSAHDNEDFDWRGEFTEIIKSVIRSYNLDDSFMEELTWRQE